MFDKLQFWKKEENSLDENPFDSPTAERHPFGADTTNPFMGEGAQSQPGPEVPSFDQPSADPLSTAPASMDYTSDQPSDPFAQQQAARTPSNMASPQTLRSNDFAQATAEATPQTSNSQYGGEMQKKDVELILSRLDLIKSELDNVQHKLSLLEQMNQKPKW